MRVTRQQALFSGLLTVLMLATGALLMPTEHSPDTGAVAPAAVSRP
ncbi:hypothetical protein [Amnibacterium endophyticum]|uniref:Uncharacterized protein n=1 Tax=Amnibacterium endophyticum TaxID=2109337 RepID=A0ABW4LAZ0_9MICO